VRRLLVLLNVPSYLSPHTQSKFCDDIDDDDDKITPYVSRASIRCVCFTRFTD